MRRELKLTEAGQQYSAAHAAHYSGQDLLLAARLYQEIIASHPNDPEAAYAGVQVQNIVNVVIPKEKLLDVQLALLRTHFLQFPVNSP